MRVVKERSESCRRKSMTKEAMKEGCGGLNKLNKQEELANQWLID